MSAAHARRDALDAVLAGFALQAPLIVSGVLAARMLGPENRGLLALIWIVALVLAQLGTHGMPAALAVFLARGRDDPRGLIAGSFRSAVAQTAITVPIQALALVVVFSGTRQPALGSALASLCVLPAMIAQAYGISIVQGLGNVRAMQALRVLPLAVYAVALAAGLVAGEDDLLFITIAWTGSYAAAAALTLAVVRRAMAKLADRRPGATVPMPQMRRFAWRAMLGTVSPLESFRLDQLLVGLMLSAHALGLYVAALAFTSLPRFVAQGIGQAAVARIAPLTDADEIRAAVRRHTFMATAGAVAISAPLSVLAEPLTELFFGSSFTAAAPMMQVLQVGTVLVCARRVLADALRGAGEPAAGSLAELWAYLVLVPALPLGAAVGGAKGVTWALAASALFSLLVLIALASRRGLLAAPPPPMGVPAEGRP